MKFGIFGDIHSNQEALEAVLEDMQAQGVVHPICLGDVVGYNANPAECLQMVRALECPIVKGNHDEEASEERDIAHFNPMASDSMRYTRDQLSDEQKAFLRGLPLQRAISNFTVVHSTLDGPARWGYVFSEVEAESSFTYQRTQICFFGHTHVPNAFVKDESIHMFLYKKIEIQPDKRYFINVGSVGQPRDGDWRAAYATYDSDANVVELHRVTYDLSKAQHKILAAELSPRLAERLASAV